MMFKFQTYYDLSTSAASVQVITVKVGGKELQKRCTHLLGAYKWYKFGRASVKLIPAATLPVDPQGMSYASDDPQTVDPRDQLNPGMCRVTNGEDVFTDMSSLTAEQQERMYRTSMLDPRWSKFMLQHGFFRSATPLLWSIAELHQDAYPGSNINLPYNTGTQHTTPAGAADSGTFDGENTYGIQSVSPLTIVGGTGHPKPPVLTSWVRKEGISSDRALIQTGHKVRMQWLPTDMLQGVTGSDQVGEQFYTGPNVCPTVPLMTIVLPKANKTLYYYRLYITQTVYFSGPRQVSPMSEDGAVVCGFDNFLLGRAVTVNPKNGIQPNYNPNVYDNGDGA